MVNLLDIFNKTCIPIATASALGLFSE